ncbi:MAG: kinase/pyrophosphorylase [Anaerolineales bacterium]|nr:kinase/pyrophosphorylase [Anaerolineales bacterium]
MVLAGVSRTGKPPLSIFLDYRGWRVATKVPIIKNLKPLSMLFSIDPHRVIAVTIDTG